MPVHFPCESLGRISKADLGLAELDNSRKDHATKTCVALHIP